MTEIAQPDPQGAALAAPADAVPLAEDTCVHPECHGTPDADPKYHVIAPVIVTDENGQPVKDPATGEFKVGPGWKTYHHDCAALLGHAKALLVVRHTEGAKGHALRALLTDPDHPVHQAILDHTAAEAADIAASAATQEVQA